MTERKFIGKVCKHFMCPVCMDVMVDAVALPCGHEFCETCLLASLAQRSSCPACRATETKHVPAYEKRRRIQALPVACCYSTQGCPFEDVLSRIENHERYHCIKRPQISEPLAAPRSLPPPLTITWVLNRPGCLPGNCPRCWDTAMIHRSNNGRCGLCDDCYEETSPW